MADMSTFFREATLRICGSLDIESVAEDCLEYLKDYIPLDGILITHYDEKNSCLIYLAAATRIPLNLNGNKVIQIPQDLTDWYVRNKSSLAEPVHIFNEPEKPPLHMEAWKSLGLLNTSSLLLRVTFMGKRLGQIDFFCMGRDRYTSEHADLISQLYRPFSIALANALQYREIVNIKELLSEDNRSLRNALHGTNGTKIIGAHGGLKDVMNAVEQVASLESSVLLLGETGVGKEVIAHSIHNSSPRRDGPFIAVNCGAIPEGLINTEMFGHEKGAFSGALNRKPGTFELAHGGTIFLDEVGDLPAHAQAALLRVLQEKEFWRVGGTKPVKADVRVIAATNRDLEELVGKGTFRQDLLFRLSVFPIVIPPLRERESDIPELVHHFIEKKSREMNLRSVPLILAGTIEQLKSYDWPGNVRELENIVERALIRRRVLDPMRPLGFEDFFSEIPSPVCSLRARPAEEIGAGPSLDDAMREHIRKTLKKAGGKVQGPGGAADLLGIKPNTLRHRMRKLGIPFGKNA